MTNPYPFLLCSSFRFHEGEETDQPCTGHGGEEARHLLWRGVAARKEDAHRIGRILYILRGVVGVMIKVISF